MRGDQPVTTVRAAGTEVFERRRQKRVERLKFRWIRQQLSGKHRGAARRRQRMSSSSSSCSGDDAPRTPHSDSVFDDDDVAMTTTSGTLADPQPSTSHVITINGTAHPVRESLTPGELVQLRQRAATTSRSSAVARRRSNDGPTVTALYDIQRRPLPNIAEEERL